MLASLIAISLVTARQGAPDFAKPITYDANALSAKQVMADLSRLAGVRFECRGDGLADHLILHFESAPLKDVLQKIALVTFSKWENTGAVTILQRDPAQLTQNEKETRAKNLEKINKVFASYRKRLAKQQAFDAEQAKQAARMMTRFNRMANNQNGGFWTALQKLQQTLPLGRAMDRVLLSLSPEILADLPIKSRIPLSNEPTSMEYQLPDAALSAIGTLVEEQAIWADAAQRYSSAVNGEEGYQPEYEGMTQKSFRNATRALLFLSRYSHSFGVSAELLLADSKGKVLGRTSSGIYDYNDPEDAPKPATTPAVRPLPTIPLSPLGQQAVPLLSSDWSDRGKAPVVSGELRNAVLHPTKVDPLSLIYGDGLIAMAKLHHENLAVLADDQMITMGGVMVKDKAFNQDIVRKADIPYFPEEVKIADGWYTARPVNMADYADNLISRPDLEVLLSDLDKNGAIPIDSLADFAYSCPPGESQLQTVITLANGVVQGSGQILQQNDWDTLRFYGSLDRDQRTSAAKQGFARLNASQMALANKLVFGNYSRLQMDYTPSPDGTNEYGDFWNSLKHEPTEALPEGIPGNAYFTLAQDNGAVILAEMQYGQWYQGLQIQEPESLSWMLYQSKHGGGDNWQVLSMQAAERHQINIQFTLTPKLNQTMSLAECKASGKRAVDIAGLPDSVRDRLAKAYAEVEKNNREGTMTFSSESSGGGNNGQPK